VTTGGRRGDDPGRALEAAWERTDRIFGFVTDDALLARPIPLRQPLLFYVGHLPAFAWNHLGRGALALPAFAPDLDHLFEAGIDPRDDAEPPRQDDAALWPPLDAIVAYRNRVRSELRGTLGNPALAEVLPMVLEHELMHQETLLYMIQQLPTAAKRPPAHLAAPPSSQAPSPALERVRVPAGLARLGTRSGGFSWDNERPECEMHTEAFEIDSLPVTNHEFREFVAAGCYADPRFWTEDAWRWLKQTHRAMPHGWSDGAGGWTVATLFEEVPFDAAAEWPVSVSHCEAQAFARWNGVKLPSEPEFHRAAFATPDGGLRSHPWGDAAPTPEHANVGLSRYRPTPVGSHPLGASAFGVHELIGNGWEWTATPFRPFPGFRPLERYRRYSADFFDDRHFVLLGGSWATDLRLIRRSFRNWFQPHYPYVFTKFRRVYPAR
jgi:ergothioneine biosynthesis protein EgtB